MSTLLNQLVAAYLMGNNAPPFTQADYIGGRHLTAPNLITPETGTIPPTFVQLDPAIPQYLTYPEDTAFGFSKAVTMAVWFRINNQSGGTILNKYIAPGGLPRGWQLITSASDPAAIGFIVGTVDPIPIAKSVASGSVLNADTWYLAVFWWDSVNNNIYLRIGNGVPASTHLRYALRVSVTPFTVGVDSALTHPFDGDIGPYYIWNRVLTEDEVTLLASGSQYPWADAVDDCTTVDCCKDPETVYDASNPTPSGAETGGTSGGGTTPPVNPCSPVPIVTIEPTSGSALQYPSVVILTCTRDDATIFYTTDGSTPTTSSTPYDGPFNIASSGQVIKAVAVVQGCDPGPIATAQYPASPFVWSFEFLCDTPDLVGKWGVFVPSDGPDYHWRFQFTLGAAKTITRIELYQTDGNGIWNTGQSWATDEYINPVNKPPHFHTFPLEIWAGCDTSHIPPTACGTQLNSAYLATLGTFGAASYVWDFYGQPVYPLVGFFKLIVFFSDGTILERIISVDCVPPPPPPCNIPATPTLTPTCGGLDVTFSETVGLPYKLYRSAHCADLPVVEALIASDVIATTPQTFHDLPLNPACTYCYRIEVKYAGCDYISSAYVCGVPKCFVSVSLTASTTEACVGDTVTLSYESSCVDGGTVTITHGDCGGIGAVIATPASNTSGTVDVVVTVDSCFSITGVNSCGSVCADACVTVQPAASCSPDMIALTNDVYTIDGFNAHDFFGDLAVCMAELVPGNFFCQNVLGSGWDGKLIRSVPGTCYWAGGEIAGISALYDTPITFPAPGFQQTRIQATLTLVATQWVLTVQLIVCTGGSPSGTMDLWVGLKPCGTPLGQYGNMGGCAAGPPAITLV